MNYTRTVSALAASSFTILAMAGISGCDGARKEVAEVATRSIVSRSRAASPMIYRGAMIGPKVDKDDIADLAIMHVNLIRWQMVYTDGSQALAKASKEQYLAWLENVVFPRLDELLPVCNDKGIKVILDLHSGPGGVVDQQQVCLIDPEWRTVLTEVWDMIVKKYDSSPTVLGYDLLNEPQLNVSQYAIWNKAAADLTEQIRKLSSKVIVIETLRDNIESINNLEPVAASNVWYSGHMYIPKNITFQGVVDPNSKEPPKYPKMVAPYPGKSPESGLPPGKRHVVEALDRVLKFQKTHGNLPIYIGEFSCSRESGKDGKTKSENALNYLRDVIGMFEKNKWHWTYHAFRESEAWDQELPSKADKVILKNRNTRINLLIRYWNRNTKKVVGK